MARTKVPTSAPSPHVMEVNIRAGGGGDHKTPTVQKSLVGEHVGGCVIGWGLFGVAALHVNCSSLEAAG